VSHCLVILNARNLVQFHGAVSELDTPKLWLTGYTEAELADGVFDSAISDTPYDFYVVVSDDAIVRQHALSGVLEALEEGAPVATGYSQRTHSDWVVNVTSGPLRTKHPSAESYDFRLYKEVVSWPEPLVPTWFTGMSLTGMSREMWQKYPFGCFTNGQESGYASDFHLSRRLQDHKVPIVAVREAFCYHWRTEWQHTNNPEDEVPFVGSVVPSVILEGERVAS